MWEEKREILFVVIEEALMDCFYHVFGPFWSLTDVETIKCPCFAGLEQCKCEKNEDNVFYLCRDWPFKKLHFLTALEVDCVQKCRLIIFHLKHNNHRCSTSS